MQKRPCLIQNVGFLVENGGCAGSPRPLTFELPPRMRGANNSGVVDEAHRTEQQGDTGLPPRLGTKARGGRSRSGRMATLEEVLAAMRADAVVLRRFGDAAAAEQLERYATGVETVTQDFREWLTEAEARLRSGKSIAWLRKYFPEWEAAGLAKQAGRNRQYRALVIPRRVDIETAREAGRREALSERTA